MKRLVLTLLPAALGVALAGCGGSGGKHFVTTRSSEGSSLVVAIGRNALAGVDLGNGATLLSPTRLAIVTSGSSSCPAVPNRLVVENPDTIRIHLTLGVFRPIGNSGRTRLVTHATHAICTADLTTTPMVIAIDPKRVDVHRPLTIRLYYYTSKKPITRTAPAL
ncbi:MAG TPA: hypothetical protein VHZ77_00690 [Gaiellaceae bacterium]|nr:hypothetical protein [Gaiellaceae bacterium]